jgi:hypothetical protein
MESISPVIVMIGLELGPTGAAGPDAVAFRGEQIGVAAQLASATVREGEPAELRVDAHRLVSFRVVRRG